MLNMEEWMALYQETMLRCFGERVRFIGLQGSRARGEASENSDIDVVLLLDRLAPEDLEKYRRAAAGLPRRELLCGFVSGVSELKNWERGELFQFYYDTTPVLGRLEEVITPPGREDAARAALAGSCAIYHLCVHNGLHGRELPVLYGAAKSVRCVLQAEYFLADGVFLRRREELEARLSPEETRVWKAVTGREEDLDDITALLLHWSGRLIRTCGTWGSGEPHISESR